MNIYKDIYLMFYGYSKHKFMLCVYKYESEELSTQFWVELEYRKAFITSGPDNFITRQLYFEQYSSWLTIFANGVGPDHKTEIVSITERMKPMNFYSGELFGSLSESDPNSSPK